MIAKSFIAASPIKPMMMPERIAPIMAEGIAVILPEFAIL